MQSLIYIFLISFLFVDMFLKRDCGCLDTTRLKMLTVKASQLLPLV